MRLLLLLSFAVSFRKTASSLIFNRFFFMIVYMRGGGGGANNSNGVNFEHHRKLLSL